MKFVRRWDWVIKNLSLDTKVIIEQGESGSESLESLPIAHVFGHPVLSVPKDLYIPPDALTVYLESFEGPLDLLLYLIKKQNIDILNIPVALITDQYLSYIKRQDLQLFELASEYLLMAAVLIEIKSRLLLPPERIEQNEEVEDPRARLVEQLLEYEKMQQAAKQLDGHEQAMRDFLWAEVYIEAEDSSVLPNIDLSELRSAWLRLLKQAEHRKSHEVSTKKRSMHEQTQWVLARLEHGKSMRFEDLFEWPLDKSFWILTFLALLELLKSQKIELRQDVNFGVIYLNSCA